MDGQSFYDIKGTKYALLTTDTYPFISIKAGGPYLRKNENENMLSIEIFNEDMDGIEASNIIHHEKRRRIQTKRFHDESYVPGSNNQYTVGRKTDTWDRNY